MHAKALDHRIPGHRFYRRFIYRSVLTPATLHLPPPRITGQGVQFSVPLHVAEGTRASSVLAHHAMYWESIPNIASCTTNLEPPPKTRNLDSTLIRDILCTNYHISPSYYAGVILAMLHANTIPYAGIVTTEKLLPNPKISSLILFSSTFGKT